MYNVRTLAHTFGHPRGECLRLNLGAPLATNMIQCRASSSANCSTLQMTNAVVVAAGRPLPGSLRLTEALVAESQSASQVMVELRGLGPVEAVVAGRLVDLG